jgi:(E)-4-hydroxy-3-methylbut-2-enyl-diphosphate synthase
MPGGGETPAAPVFIDGENAVTLRGGDGGGGFQEDGD